MAATNEQSQISTEERPWFGTLNRFLLALLFSTHGIWMLRVALGWVTWDITGSAFWVGLISSVTLFPTMFLTPIFGVMADRIKLRIAMPIVMATFCGLSAILAVLSASGVLELWGLVAMASIFGLTISIYHSFRVTIPARIDVQTPLQGIIGMTSIVFNLSGIIGPALAGLILALVNEAAVFVIVSLLYLGYLLLFRTLRFKQKSDPLPFPGFFSEFSSGIRVALGLPELLIGVSTVFLSGLIGRSLVSQLPTVTGALLQGDAGVYASLVAASAGGAVVAGVVMARLKDDRTRIRRTLYLAAFASMALSGLCGAVVAYFGFLIAMALLGFLLTVVGACSQSILQLAVPDDFRGRVMSFWSMAANGGPAIGVLILGAAADMIGMRPALFGAGGIGVLMISGVFWADHIRTNQAAKRGN